MLVDVLILHLVVEHSAALPGEDGEAPVEEVDEVIRLERDLEAEALPDDDVPRGAELLVEVALDVVGDAALVPRESLAGHQDCVQNIFLQQLKRRNPFQSVNKSPRGMAELTKESLGSLHLLMTGVT